MSTPAPGDDAPKLYTCVYCGVGFPKRTTGDHVIPQGFGQFSPELVLDNVCQPCDNKHGGKIELAIMRKGLSGWTRFRNKIKSDNNKGKPLFNPLTDPSNTGDRKYFGMEVETDGIVASPAFDSSGNMHKPYIVGFVMQDGTEILEGLNSSLTIAEMDTFIKARFAHHKAKGVFIRASLEVLEQIQTLIRGRGGDPTKMQRFDKEDADTPQNLNIHLQIILGKPYVQGCANVLFKALVYLGYDPALISRLRRFIKYGTLGPHERAMADAHSCKPIIDDTTPITDFCHRIQWQLNNDYLIGAVSLFGNKKGTQFGAVIVFKIRLCHSRNLIPSSQGAVFCDYRTEQGGVITAYFGEAPVVLPLPRSNQV